MQYTKSRMLKIGVVLFLCLSSYYAFYSIPYASCTVTWSYNPTTNTATASGAGSTNFAALVAADTAGGWGKFTSDATGTQILCQGRIVIGDGTNACVFSDYLKQIIFVNGSLSAANQALITNKSNSTLTLGIVSSTVSYSTYQGCSIIDLQTGFQHYIIYSSSSYTSCPIYLYSCQISGVYQNSWVGIVSAAGGRIWNTIFTQYACPYACSSAVDFYRVTSQLNTYGIRECAGTFDYIITHSCTNAISIYQTQSRTIKNLIVYESNTQYVCVLWSITSDSYLINTLANYWRFNWQGTSTAKVFRQYEFDLSVLNGEITEFVEDANVTLTKGSYRGTWLTNSSGQIDSQTLTYGYYNQANGDNIQDSTTPFTLTVTHPDWATYTSRFYVTEKTKMTISMQEVTPQASPDPEQYTSNDEVATYAIVGCMIIIALLCALILWRRN